MEEKKQLQHNTSFDPGGRIKYSAKTAYLPCFIEGDTLSTWVARHADAILASKGFVPDLLVEMAEGTKT